MDQQPIQVVSFSMVFVRCHSLGSFVVTLTLQAFSEAQSSLSELGGLMSTVQVTELGCILDTGQGQSTVHIDSKQAQPSVYIKVLHI